MIDSEAISISHMSRLGEHIFCHPREGGEPVFHRRFNRLLDSRLRGNDKRGSVPAFLSKLIPHECPESEVRLILPLAP